MKKFWQSSMVNALATTVYVFLVVLIMSNANKIFGQMNGYLGPLAFLLLFVLSAAVTGSLVLGRPIALYWEGKKKEAVKHFALTCLYLLIILVLTFIALWLSR